MLIVLSSIQTQRILALYLCQRWISILPHLYGNCFCFNCLDTTIRGALYEMGPHLQGSKTHMGATMRLGSRRTYFQVPNCKSAILWVLIFLSFFFFFLCIVLVKYWITCEFQKLWSRDIFLWCLLMFYTNTPMARKQMAYCWIRYVGPLIYIPWPRNRAGTIISIVSNSDPFFSTIHLFLSLG